MKLAVFDFDSTLMDGETIDFLAKELGVEEEVSTITIKAMAGELDFFESLQTRVNLLKGLDYRKVIEICNNLPIMNGAKDTIKELKKMNYKIVCFSGGFTTATIPICKKIGIDTQFANILHTKNNTLTGLVGGYMMFNNSKGDMIKKLQDILKISYQDTLVIGDGANDISMFKYANKKVAFCANEVLKDNANIIIDKKDLKLILEKV